MIAPTAPAVTGEPPSQIHRKLSLRSTSASTVFVVRLAFVVAVILIWQFVAGGPKSILPIDVVGQPSSVASTFWSLVKTGNLFPAWGTTMWHLVVGVAISAPVGVILGSITSTRVGRWVFGPVITILYAIPKVALITIYILVLGIGPRSHIALVISAVIFVYFFSTEQAYRELDHDRMTALKMMGASKLKMAWSYLLPSATPQLFAATRIAIPLAFTTEIYAEFRIPGSEGLGVLLSNYEQFINGPGLMAIFLFVIVVAYALDVVMANLLGRYTASIGVGVQV